MPGQVVVFGATGYTGRLTAQRLVAEGASPVLAGRSPERLAALAAELGGLEWRHADAERPESVSALVGAGDVLLTTVGPFARWGGPALAASVGARAAYVDSTGEPAFIQSVFSDWDGPARRAGVALLTAMGYDYVPGTLAGALALEAAGEAGVRVDVGYYAFGAQASRGTRRSLVGVALEGGYRFAGGQRRAARPAERSRSFRVKGAERQAVSIGGAEHFGLPAAYPRLEEVNVYVGWAPRLVAPTRAVSLAASVAVRLPGARPVLHAAGERLADVGGGAAPSGPEPQGTSRVVAEAYDGRGAALERVELVGPDPYVLTAGLLAWAATEAAAGAVNASGALGPVQAFGLERLRAGCARAGLVPAAAS